MLRSLSIRNFTVFAQADLDFVDGLNVIVGDNGTGKTHLLKLPYAFMAMSADEHRKRTDRPTKTLLQTRLAEKIINVFRPEDRLGRLARRQPGRSRCEVKIAPAEPGTGVAFRFASQNTSEVVIDRLPRRWRRKPPVFIPTRELLTIYPGFTALYDNRLLEFDETWRDTCQLLGAPPLRGPRDERIARLLEPLEAQMGGRVQERKDRFYLEPFGARNMEMPLVAEGLRKLAMLARLIATGSLLEKGCLFWDEPEANLNPRLIREVARAILRICGEGVQVCLATHSLFLLREFEVLLREPAFAAVRQRYFALRREGHDVRVSQADSMEDIDPLVLLDEDLAQSDRFLRAFMP